MHYPSHITLVEVGPRDGLQNEATPVPTDVKLQLIQRLAAAGLTHIEAGSFVSPKRVPQMADSADIVRALQPAASPLHYPVLTPNLQGFDAALAAGAREVAVFAAASERFSQRNIQCSIADSLARFAPVLAAARQHGVAVRGYVSCVLGCPYEGDIAPQAVADVSLRLLEMGCTEISLGDTIGVGTPAGVRRLLDALLPQIPASQLAGHFHDTYGMAIANIVAAMECGLATFDSSVAGLGGCPYAQGASGNVATEDVVWLLNGLGVECGVSLEALLDASALISGFLGKPPASRVARALLAKRGRE